FHVTGVQTCALPIFQPRSSVCSVQERGSWLFFPYVFFSRTVSVIFRVGIFAANRPFPNTCFSLAWRESRGAHSISSDEFKGKVRSEERRVGKEGRTR